MHQILRGFETQLTSIKVSDVFFGSGWSGQRLWSFTYYPFLSPRLWMISKDSQWPSPSSLFAFQSILPVVSRIIALYASIKYSIKYLSLPNKDQLPPLCSLQSPQVYPVICFPPNSSMNIYNFHSLTLTPLRPDSILDLPLGMPEIPSPNKCVEFVTYLWHVLFIIIWNDFL